MDLVAAVFLVCHVPRDSGPHQGLTGNWSVWLPPAPHLDLVILVCTETTLDLVMWSPPGLRQDLGTPVPILASPGPFDHGPQLGKIGTR